MSRETEVAERERYQLLYMTARHMGYTAKELAGLDEPALKQLIGERHID